MTTDTVQKEVKSFYQANKETALQSCLDEGFDPFFMPDLVEARLDGSVPWNEWTNTVSTKITGRTNQGSAVVVYAHVPTSLATPKGILDAKSDGLVNYAAHFPQGEFQKLVDGADGESVWVVDHADLVKTPSNVIAVAEALEHPQTIPFIGSASCAEKYLAGHREAYETDKIGVWHTDDLDDSSPLARLLCLGGYIGGVAVAVCVGLVGDDVVDYGRFFGVRDAEGAKKSLVYTPQQIREALSNLKLSGLESQILDALREAQQ